MTEATIIVLPKEGKDPPEVTSYRPISPLCSDVKILGKVLAARLNRIISKIVHPDQSEFIPDRATSANIRWVYLSLQLPMENQVSRAILALDAIKAFDGFEWHYLWRVLIEFQFGPDFINLNRTLYEAPRAKVKINSECSEFFRLARGTRQGCPLTPLFFSLAVDWLFL